MRLFPLSSPVSAIASVGLSLLFILSALPAVGQEAGGAQVANTSAFVNALNFARTEAVRRGERVTLCRLGEGSRCDITPCTACDWNRGWMVAVDPNGPLGWENPATPASHQILRLEAHPHSGSRLAISGAFRGFFSFSAAGEPQTSGGQITGLFELSDPRGRLKGRHIVVNASRHAAGQ